MARQNVRNATRATALKGAKNPRRLKKERMVVRSVDENKIDF